MINNLKHRTYVIMNLVNPEDRYARAFNIFIMTLIIINVLSVILETVQSIDTSFKSSFYNFEVVSVTIFTIEYVLRIWSCTESQEGNALTARLKYIASPMALIDLAAILHFYIPMIITLDLRFIRAIRLFRIFRIFKISRYSGSLQMLINVIRSKKPELLVTVFVLAILLVISSSLMYFIENEKQPELFSSIPAAMWWGVSTLTTVGYGDIFPVTYAGKLLGAVISIIGIGLFALPTGILASGLIDEMHNKKNESAKEIKKCPHCGKDISI